MFQKLLAYKWRPFTRKSFPLYFIPVVPTYLFDDPLAALTAASRTQVHRAKHTFISLNFTKDFRQRRPISTKCREQSRKRGSRCSVLPENYLIFRTFLITFNHKPLFLKCIKLIIDCSIYYDNTIMASNCKLLSIDSLYSRMGRPLSMSVGED